MPTMRGVTGTTGTMIATIGVRSLTVTTTAISIATTAVLRAGTTGASADGATAMSLPGWPRNMIAISAGTTTADTIR
jgi:hypothetical protein